MAVAVVAFPQGHVLDPVARLGLLPTEVNDPMAVVAGAAHHLLAADRDRSTRPQDRHRNSRAVSSSPLAER
jgi:hypothetical protein